LRKHGLDVLVLLTGTTLLTALVLVFWHAPVEPNMGVSQKIFYFHVPSAVAAYLGYGLCGLSSLIYILKPSPFFSRLALAGAELGSIFALAVLTTGPLWAYKAWGRAWMWDPRLSSVLLMFLVFTSYLMLRRFTDDTESSRRIGAVLGTLGLLAIALSRFSVQLWGGFHPQVLTGSGRGIAASMVPAFALSMVAVLLLCVTLIAMRERQLAQLNEVQRIGRELEALSAELSELESSREQHPSGALNER
jgi:heme exporter protein C